MIVVQGDALECLKGVEGESVDCCVTSPPYYGLRDYGTEKWEGGDAGCDHKNTASVQTGKSDGHSIEQPGRANTIKPYRDACGKCGARRADKQIGLERTPAEYIARLVEVFREVRRVLKPDGTLFVVIGDSYARSSRKEQRKPGHSGKQAYVYARGGGRGSATLDLSVAGGLKEKDLIGIPWMLAFALRDDGWWLRQDIIWAKPNPMPESVRDRCTKAHEYIFLLTKSERYYWNAVAIAEPLATDPKENYPDRARITGRGTQGAADARGGDRDKSGGFPCNGTRNARSVWTITPKPFKEAHFATFPPELVRRCLNAGCPPGGIALDPFCGAGTTGLVCAETGRDFIGIELNADYCRMAVARIGEDVCCLVE